MGPLKPAYLFIKVNCVKMNQKINKRNLYLKKQSLYHKAFFIIIIIVIIIIPFLPLLSECLRSHCCISLSPRDSPPLQLLINYSFKNNKFKRVRATGGDCGSSC